MGPDFVSPRSKPDHSGKNAVSPQAAETAHKRAVFDETSPDEPQPEAAPKEDTDQVEEYDDEDENDIAARARSNKNALYRFMYVIVTNPMYNFVVFCLILMNTVVLAIDDFP